MKVFVTGATGFVGSHLCRRLLDMNNEVYGLVRNNKKLKDENLNIIPIAGSLAPSAANDWINTLPDDLDCVIHVAGIVHSSNDDDFFSINTKATQQLIQDLKLKFKKIKFIFISSLAAAGPGEKTEDDELSPVSSYGLSKKQAEELLPKDWDITIIRPPMVIGPGDPAILDIYKMVKSRIVLTAGKSSRHNRYSFVCVFDLVEAITKCLDKDKSTGDYFISHEKVISFEEIINEISKCMNVKPTYLPMPVGILKVAAQVLKRLPVDFRLTPDKVNELIEPSWVCSNKKSIEQLEMNYQWNLSKTIKETYNDYQQRHWI